LSLAEIYFAFGWWGLPVFAMLVGSISWVDGVWRNGCTMAGVEEGFQRVSAGFYMFALTLFSLSYVGSLFMVVGFPFGLSADFMLMAVLFVVFVKAGSLRILVRKSP
jgi:hypothetical protein